MKITIIIPVRNEGESIGSLIDGIFSETKKIVGHIFAVLVVDGQSTDNTQHIVEEKKSKNPNVHLITEKDKKGLGNAYLLGMNYAIDTLATDAFIEFDGDFQHDPKDIHKLVKKLDEGYAYVIGSRYIPGGTIPQEWPWYRKVLSIGGNFIIRLGLSIPTHDNTSGFKLTKVAPTREKMPLRDRELISLRHAYKIHFLYSIVIGGIPTVEVPINFLNRNKGVSKSTVEDIIESLKVVFLLRKNDLRDRIRGKNKARIDKKA
jgi:dolichol-phosphate mannosyltransferase